MRRRITMAELREALKAGKWTLERDSMFFLRRGSQDHLYRPSVVIKADVDVEVEKVYRRGRCALLKYVDRTGKTWWSWTHATEYERPRRYWRKKAV
jgi:hypothetical protein